MTEVIEACDIVIEWIIESEMGGYYDPDDSWAPVINSLNDIKDKVVDSL